jgi:hypothetical protein
MIIICFLFLLLSFELTGRNVGILVVLSILASYLVLSGTRPNDLYMSVFCTSYLLLMHGCVYKINSDFSDEE